jgi:DAK2 domain fusion protein YloV
VSLLLSARARAAGQLKGLDYTLASPGMERLERLGADHLASAVVAYRDVLRSHQEVINRLNVYPVPDGDTGTNMALTLESVVDELAQKTDLEGVTRAISHGSLMGARGNSGVILSQILRGIADAFRDDPDGGGGPTVVAALDRATTGAYAAVTRPVEGTILSVVRAASEGAKGAPGGLTEVLEAAQVGATDALARTPEQLPVLKQAGVVDAGGAGIVLLFDALLHVVDGRPLPDPPVSTTELPVAPLRRRGEDAVGALRYEVMYFLEAPDDTIPAFRDVWAGVGDSIVVVGGEGLWNCHIHTDDIGAAVEAALDAGRPRDIRVTDLFEQVDEERWVREATAGQAPQADVEPVNCAVVAVATGDGIRRIFHSLGVQHVIAGGQSMNPSTAQILEAIEAAPADQVVVLPNNKNIIPVARQAAASSSKAVQVVDTFGIAEGFAALLEYDPEADLESNARAMAASADRIVSGEVTRAVRDSTCAAGNIHEGDYLGLSRSGIEAVAPSLAEAAVDLLAKLVTDDHELVTVIEGLDATKADTRRITQWLEEHRPGVGREVHHGGQPLYPYLFSIE